MGLSLISRQAESLAALDNILRQYQAEGHDISAILGMSRKRKRVAAAVPEGIPRGQIADGGSAGRSSAASGPEASPIGRTRRADSGSAARDTLSVTPSAGAGATPRVNGHAPLTPSRGSREAAIVVDDDSDADVETTEAMAAADGHAERSSKRPRIESASQLDDSGSQQRTPTQAQTQAQVRVNNVAVTPHRPTWVADNAADLQDDQHDARAQSQSHPDALRPVPANEPVVTPRKGRPRTFLGCNICGYQKFHPAAQCPVVLAGPASISA